jgi:hypothetical protein
MEQIQGFLQNVKLGGKQSHLNMTLIPLLAPDAGPPDFITQASHFSTAPAPLLFRPFHNQACPK